MWIIVLSISQRLFNSILKWHEVHGVDKNFKSVGKYSDLIHYFTKFGNFWKKCITIILQT